jgi:hypothetical protein
LNTSYNEPISIESSDEDGSDIIEVQVQPRRQARPETVVDLTQAYEVGTRLNLRDAHVEESSEYTDSEDEALFRDVCLLLF